MLAKGRPGERWRRVFIGDPEGARCSDAPPALTAMPSKAEGGGLTSGRGGPGCPASYRLFQLERETFMEMHVSC